MMTSTQLLGLSFILMLLGVPLISFGVGTALGSLLILIGAALPPIARMTNLVKQPKQADESN